MNIAIIDTETSYRNEVISIGVVIANIESFKIVSGRYYVIYPECTHSAMFQDSLYLKEAMKYLYNNTKCSFKEACKDLVSFLDSYLVQSIFAYNAPFDYRCFQPYPNMVGTIS